MCMSCVPSCAPRISPGGGTDVSCNHRSNNDRSDDSRVQLIFIVQRCVLSEATNSVLVQGSGNMGTLPLASRYVPPFNRHAAAAHGQRPGPGCCCCCCCCCCSWGGGQAAGGCGPEGVGAALCLAGVRDDVVVRQVRAGATHLPGAVAALGLGLQAARASIIRASSGHQQRRSSWGCMLQRSALV